jgi:SAM-dependent methyltransferase
MKLFELARLGAEPLLPPLHKQVRQRLKQIAGSWPFRPLILDVGGRKSPYTIGVPADVIIIDLPRDTEIQQQLNLGLNRQIVEDTYQRRSNIRQVVLGDMTCSKLPSESFDCVVAVEVLEHVEEDALFVREVHRVLKPGGIFLMTTPNGDSVKNTNPDHKRHYRREQLMSLLSFVFEKVDVNYAISGGKYRRLGLKSWSVRHPVQTGLSMMGNVINSIQSAGEEIKYQSHGTYHLIAVAEKKH